MKKYAALLLALCGLLAQPAGAAPIGWYDLSASWRDGSFAGKFYYDAGSPSRITQIDGMLTDTAQQTPITTVWTADDLMPASWVFASNTNSAEAGGHDAGFYLNLIDLGATLALDLAADNGLYDWSNDYAFYVPDQLDDSPLRAYSIQPSQTVPEPGGLALFAMGLTASVAAAWRRRKEVAASVDT
jgi:hypothetical protein